MVHKWSVADPAVPGLMLRVGPNTSKRWLLRFKWENDRTRIAIGQFPEVGIAQARECALRHRKEINDGIDPRRTARPTSRQSLPPARRGEIGTDCIGVPEVAER
jgi:hypothetical protein